MKLALAGLPGSGKSTLFSALTNRRLASGRGREESNLALLPVPDERIERLSALYKPQKTTYAQVTYIDPALPPAKTGDAAMRLPDELRQVDGLVVVVRNFDGGMGPPDPKGDLERFLDELVISDLVSVESRLERITEENKRGKKGDPEEIRLLEKAKDILSSEKLLRSDAELSGHVRLRGFGFYTAKPLILVANNEEGEAGAPDLGEYGPPVVIRAQIEAELAELEPDERDEFMAELGFKESALDRLIGASLQALDVISFITVGEDEVKAWTVKRGATAVQAAGTIHSDMERGFIRAEIIRYEDLMSLGSENEVKKAGLMKLVGRDHVIEDGDLIQIRFNI